MFRYLIPLFVIMMSCCLQTEAQYRPVHDDLFDLDISSFDVLPPLDNETLKKRYKAESKHTSNRFAEPRDVHITPANNGFWEVTKSGEAVWRYAVKSPNAHTINLGFTEFKLPPTASLYIYNKNKSQVLGPFTDKDNDDHLQLWTPVVDGDELIVELQVAPGEKDHCRLTLSRVNHDFKDIRKGLGSGSGSCNLDVVCGSEDGWPIVDRYRDIISSVGAYSYNGTDQCSGVLINNARNDCTPYFMTAAHCGISQNNAASVVVYWNYQNSTCRQPNSFESGQPGDGSRMQFNSGASLKASLNRSDFALIELDDPIDPNYGLHFAGWSRAYELPDTSLCIHHPGVEEKRISFEFNTLSYDPTNNDTTHVLVNDWDIGTTEGGSSGSPLFNAQKLIIGQLTGGFAACGNNASDSYGWIRRSWNGEGSPSNSLKPWLDPDNLGLVSLPGRSCSFNIDIESNYFELCGLDQDSLVIEMSAGGLFDGDVTFSIIDKPLLLDGHFAFTTGGHDETNSLTLQGFERLSDGDITVSIEVSDNVNTAMVDLTINYNEDLPGVPVLKSPEDETKDLALSHLFTVARGPADETRFQLATDSLFENIVVDKTSDNAQLFVTGLEESTLYFWRASSRNLCGDSPWSDTRTFRTSFLFCTRIHALDGPVEISDGSPSTISSLISFPYAVTTEDLNVPSVQGEHDYVSDLEVTLNFDGEAAILFSEVCDDENDFNIGFDDEAQKTSIDCPPTDELTYQPFTPLEVFSGLFAGGDWRLDVEDKFFLDGGQLTGWSMQVCFSKVSLPSVIPDDHLKELCGDSDVMAELFVFADGVNDVSVEIIDASGTPIAWDILATDTLRNTMNIAMPHDQFVNDSTYLIIHMKDAQGTLLAQSYLEVIRRYTTDPPQIIYPEMGSAIDSGLFIEVEWIADFSGEFDIEVARDAAFQDIVYMAAGRSAESFLIDKLLAPGDYYLRVIFKDTECNVVSSVVAFSVSPTTSIQELKGFDLNLYPNPATDRLYLNSQGLSAQTHIHVIDKTGRELPAGVDIGNGSAQLDIGHLSPGLYFLIVGERGERITLPFIKM